MFLIVVFFMLFVVMWVVDFILMKGLFMSVKCVLFSFGFVVIVVLMVVVCGGGGNDIFVVKINGYEMFKLGVLIVVLFDFFYLGFIEGIDFIVLIGGYYVDLVNKLG